MSVLNLKDVKVSEQKAKVLRDACSNLPKLNEALQDEDLFDFDTVKQALVVELREKKRPATITRLSGKLKTLLTRLVDAEIHGA